MLLWICLCFYVRVATFNLQEDSFWPWAVWTAWIRKEDTAGHQQEHDDKNWAETRQDPLSAPYQIDEMKLRQTRKYMVTGWTIYTAVFLKLPPVLPIFVHCCTWCGNTYEKRREENSCQGDERGQDHFWGYLCATATHNGCENLKHHPDEEHEVDVRQCQAQQIEHTVLHWCSCRKTERLLFVRHPGIRTSGWNLVAVPQWQLRDFSRIGMAESFSYGMKDVLSSLTGCNTDEFFKKYFENFFYSYLLKCCM